MKRRSDYSRVVLTDSTYTLLIYLLMSTKEEIEDTFFFFSDRIPHKVRAALNSHHFARTNYLGISKFFVRIFTRITRLWRWPFLRTADIYGANFLFFVPPLISRRGMTVIEDGTANYNSLTFATRGHKSRLKEILYGARINEPFHGASQWDKRVILTGFATIPEEIKPKAEVVNIQEMWVSRTPEFRAWILDMFDIRQELMEQLKERRVILVEQVLKRFGLREDEIIMLYKELLCDVDPRELVIKMHPASDVDYSEHFPGAYILKEKIPMEILSLIGVAFEDAYTVSSTSVYTMPPRTRIHFARRDVHPLVEKALGASI